MTSGLKRKIQVPAGSKLSEQEYEAFLGESYLLMSKFPQYFAAGEDINSLELAHLIPGVAETTVAIYVGINDAVCNKGLVAPFLLRHGHNNVFVFDPEFFAGAEDVPTGTADARRILNGFEPPNQTWLSEWTYVMVEEPTRTFKSLWEEKGYIDMIPAKFEDFTMLSDAAVSKVCIYIDPEAFEHPVNEGRVYLQEARRRGDKIADEFKIPAGLEGEADGLVAVVLNRGEKLYVARRDFGPCVHAWSNLHPDNKELAVVNENSAVPLDLVIAKPAVKDKYAKELVPPRGSADMTCDWFYRGRQVVRAPLLEGLVKG